MPIQCLYCKDHMHASLGLKAWPRAQKESRYKSILEHKNGMFQVGAYSL